MEDVPQETLLLVFSFLQPTDSRRVSLTCKNWNEVWQDKTLWKHFHLKFLGGKPRPPLLPKAWQKSVRGFFASMKTIKEPKSRLKYAIEQGRSAIIDKILTDHPSLLYPLAFKNEGALAFVDTHPLVMVAKHKDNLNALKVVWEHLIKTSSSDEHLQIPTRHWYIKRTAAQIARKATRMCVKSIFESGSGEMLEFLLSVAPDVKSFVIQRAPKLFVKPGYPTMQVQYNPRFFEVLKSIGVMPTLENLYASLRDAPLAHWLLNEVDWKGQLAEVVEEVLRFKDQKVQRSVVKRILQAVDPTQKYTWNLWVRGYMWFREVDVKILKWLLKRGNITTIDAETVLYNSEISAGKTKLIRFLVENNFLEVNKIFSSGKTLLHFAVTNNQKELVKALMDLGADPTIQGKKSVISPLGIARQRGQHELVEILKAGGSKDGGKGKRKRNEEQGEEENQTAAEGEGKREEQEGTKKRKVAQSKKKEKPLSEEKQEEKKLEIQIGEQLKWICERDASAKLTLKEVFDAQEKKFTVFPLKVICRWWNLSSPSQKRIDLLRTVSVFLERRQAIVQAEL